MDSLAIIVGKLGAYFCTVMLGLFIHGFGTIAVIFFICCRELPYRYISRMGQNLATAFGTGSRYFYSLNSYESQSQIAIIIIFSSATMPVTIQVLDAMGIDSRVTRFVIPVNLSLNYIVEVKKYIKRFSLTTRLGGCYSEYGWNGIV